MSSATAVFLLPQSTSIAPTTEGSIAWDTDDNFLKVGDGATTQTFVPLNPTGIAQGNIAYRNATEWVVLAPASSGFVLTTLGAAANPAWADVATIGGGGGLMTLGKTLALASGFAMP
jgi:hypothetical protein